MEWLESSIVIIRETDSGTKTEFMLGRAEEPPQSESERP